MRRQAEGDFGRCGNVTVSHIPFTGDAPGGPEEAAFIAGSGEAPEYSVSLQHFAPFKYQIQIQICTNTNTNTNS